MTQESGQQVSLLFSANGRHSFFDGFRENIPVMLASHLFRKQALQSRCWTMPPRWVGSLSVFVVRKMDLARKIALHTRVLGRYLVTGATLQVTRLLPPTHCRNGSVGFFLVCAAKRAELRILA